MTRRIPAFCVLFAALFASGTAAARARPVVIELFTSQGCSSCPPAEAVLATYARRPDVLALSFHVTYWNRLGWRDTLSFDGATQRQAAYEGIEGGASYTPQMVIDGRYSAIGSRSGEVASAIQRAAPQAGNDPGVSLSRNGNQIDVRIAAGSGSARVLLVGFDRQHKTPVGRGENAGRTIVQANVVRSIRSIGTWNGGPLVLDEAPPAGEDAAVILQAPGGRIVGAARLGAGA